MGVMHNPLPGLPGHRGLQQVRADAANDPKAAIEALNRAFAEFKTSNDEKIAEVKKGFDDVVKTEQVDRINAEVGTLQAAIDDVNRMMAALRTGAGGADADPEAAEHRQAFNRFFRKGVEGDLRDLEVKAALRTDSDPDGGFVVPKETESQIDRVLGTMSAMRSLASVRSLSTATYEKLVNIGGVSSGWVGETDTRAETNTPTLKKLEYALMEIYANPATTQRMLDDAALNIDAWLADEVMIEFAEQEGAAFVSGDGVAKPRGILSYTNVANASYAWGSVGYLATGAAASFGTSNPADIFHETVYGLKRGYRNNAKWLMNDAVALLIRKFKDGTGNYLWQPSLQLGEPASLNGYAIETDDNMPDVGADEYPIAFGDFARGYLIVDGIGIRVLRDPFTNKPYVMFYTTKRVGGGIQNFEAIKLVKCATS